MSFVRALVVLLAAGATLALTLGFSACIQLGPSNDDSTADAGIPTVQDQCSEVMAAYCSRANECYGEDVNACYPPAVQACCAEDCAYFQSSFFRDFNLKERLKIRHPAVWPISH